MFVPMHLGPWVSLFYKLLKRYYKSPKSEFDSFSWHRGNTLLCWKKKSLGLFSTDLGHNHRQQFILLDKRKCELKWMHFVVSACWVPSVTLLGLASSCKIIIFFSTNTTENGNKILNVNWTWSVLLNLCRLAVQVLLFFGFFLQNGNWRTWRGLMSIRYQTYLI